MSRNRSAPGVILALLVAALGGCRAEHTDQANHDDSVDVAPLDSAAAPQLSGRTRSWVDSIRAAERPRLAAVTGDRASRPSWNRLVLTARTGARVIFEDEIAGGEPRLLHIYGGYSDALAQHLVEIVYVPEGGVYFLVDARTGERLEVDAPPVPSPDGARFITTSLDLVAGHRPNRIRIYRIAQGRPVLEWESAPRDWGAAAPHWLDSSAVTLERTVVDTTTSPFTLRASPMRIERDGGEWRIVPS